jgi:tetratricopeptide (TPR) repeat protein/predicted Ser/Thr protein kinase
MACPDDNLLVAMDALDPARFAEIEVHIDSCEHCRKIVAAAIAGRTLAVGTPPVDDEADALAAVVDVSIGGRYVIEAVLGRGGMGTVYLARDRTLDRDVALKLHRAGSGSDRLQREALAMAKLAHPNVVTVFEIGSVDDRMYVAMEYVRGETLRGWLRAAPRGWREIVDMLAQAGAGLAAAHAAGLVHRDFKPENVLVGEDGRPRVSDFGLARVGAGRDSRPSGAWGGSLTQSGTILGTPAYMAPEQLAGATVDARCDQFAFCVVAWECLFGTRPFAGTTLAALEDAILRRDLQRPARGDVPPRVREVIERGLAVEPSARWADMPALLAALRAAATPRTKKYVAAALAGAVIVGAGAVAAVSVAGERRRAAECDAAAGAMHAVFGPGQRVAMQAAFIATGSPVAAISFERAAKVLDEYSDKLALQARAVCGGLNEPASMTAARRACLADRKAELGALVELMSKPDAGLVQRAPSAAWAIFEPAPCTDPSMLLARPHAPARRSPEQVAQLGRVKALADAGRYREAAALAAPLVDQARAREDRHLELAALIALASARVEIEPPATVAPLFQEAVQLAESLGRDLDAAGALWALANLSAVELQQYGPAHQYIALARAKLERLGGGNLGVRGELLVTEAQVLLDENRLGEADKVMQQAVATLEQALGPHHPKVGAALGTLSQILRARHADSLAVSQRTYEIFQGAYGPDHPTSAGAEMNLAQALMEAERYAEARERLQHADAVFAKVFGDVHPVRAAIAGNLAAIEQLQGNLDAAIAADRRAVAILEQAQGPDSADVSGARRDLARVLALAGRLPDAIAEMRRALAILDKLGSDAESRIVGALTEIAEYELAAHQPVLALAHAEQAVAQAARRPADANPAELGDAKFVLARALWDTRHDRVRSRKLAEEAGPLIVEAARRAELERWLREHAAP